MQQPVDVELDPMTVRLLEFVRRKGGPSKVAKQIGIKPSVFYNYEAGRNKQPAPDILQRCATHYPDFDPTYILTGQTIVKAVVAGGSANEVLAAENAGLRKEITRLEETVSILRTVVGAQLGKDLESGKNESATDTPQGQLVLFGHMKRKDRKFVSLDVRDARVMGKTWPNQAPLQ